MARGSALRRVVVVLVACAAALAALLFPSPGRGQNEETFVESMTLPNDNQIQSSINRLEAGTTYRLRISGVVDETFQEGGAPRRQLRDAFYCFAAPVTTEDAEPCNESSPVAFDYVRLVVNGEVRTLSSVGGAQPYRSDHVYSVSFTPTTTEPLIARAATVTFGGAASGNYRLEIYRPADSCPGSASGSSAAALQRRSAQADTSRAGTERPQAWTAATDPCKPKFGVDLPLQAPAPGGTLRTSSPTLPAGAKTVALDASLKGAATTTVGAATTARVKGGDLLSMCLIYGLVGIKTAEIHVKVRQKYDQNLGLFVFIACLKLLGDEASTRHATAQAAATRCHPTFIPVVAGSKPLSASRRKNMIAQARRKLRTACRSRARGTLSLSLAARGTRTVRSLAGGKHLRIAIARGQSSTSDGPNPKLVLRWKR